MDLGASLRNSKLYERPAAISAYKRVRRLAGRAGLDLLLKTFYSPIPDLDTLPEGIFDRRSALTGIAWEPERHLQFLQDTLGAHIAEFAAAPDSIAAPYTTDNPSYGVLDAAVLYGMVRHLRPSQILELGSGYSTMISAAALRKNRAHGDIGRLVVCDPFAASSLDGLDGISEVRREPAQDLSVDEFERLAADDILFVDTTHTVKLGSDVNYIILEILPRLAPGVIVHIHDVFLPYEYPRAWAEDFGLYWSEQYLVHAFLALNSSFEVVAGLGGLCRDPESALDMALPSLSNYDASALWLRRAL